MENFAGYFGFLKYLDITDTELPTVPSILANSASFYRTFKLQKRTGGYRKIDSPFPFLASIQAKILLRILSTCRVHPAACAYQKKSSAIKHASRHLGCAELLILDLKDFFPGISRQMVFQSLEKNGLSGEFSHFVALLCCLNGSLPQGACTSPSLSNIVFYQLDQRLSALAKSLDLTYSRYADDLAFSGARIPRSLSSLVQRILDSRNFLLNSNKTRLKIKGAKKIITGVSISSGTPKAPREYKRKLRAQIYELERNVDNLAGMTVIDPFIYERILGRLNYLLQIEPGNDYANHKKARLSERHQNFMNLAK